MYLLAQFVKKGKQINQHSIFMDSIYFIAGINSEFSAEARSCWCYFYRNKRTHIAETLGRKWIKRRSGGGVDVIN